MTISPQGSLIASAFHCKLHHPGAVCTVALLSGRESELFSPSVSAATLRDT